MKKTRIKDLPFYDTIAIVLKKGSKEMTIKTKYGTFTIGVYERWYDVKKGDRLRLVKCVKLKDYRDVNQNIPKLSSSSYSLFEWNSKGKYRMSKEYITWYKAHHYADTIEM